MGLLISALEVQAARARSVKEVSGGLELWWSES